MATSSTRFASSRRTSPTRNRYGLTSSLIWDVAPEHRVRVAYTYDRAKHRQTGEWGFLEDNGDPESVFWGRQRDPGLTADGFQLQQRDRKSIALSTRSRASISASSSTTTLRVEVGVRRPFFKRDWRRSATIQARDGFAYCTSEPILARGTVVRSRRAPTGRSRSSSTRATRCRPIARSIRSTRRSKRTISSASCFRTSASPITDGPISVFGSYAKGFSSPRTDNLYRAPRGRGRSRKKPTRSTLACATQQPDIQAQVAVWKIDYSNRIVVLVQPGTRHLARPQRRQGEELGLRRQRRRSGRSRNITLLALASYIKAELQDNVELGSTTSATAAGRPDLLRRPPRPANPTVELAPRPSRQDGHRNAAMAVSAAAPISSSDRSTSASRPSGSARASRPTSTTSRSTAIPRRPRRPLRRWRSRARRPTSRLNLQNLFDSFYFGNISTQIRASDNPNFAVGSPRTFRRRLTSASRPAPTKRGTASHLRVGGRFPLNLRMVIWRIFRHWAEELGS